VYGIESSAIFSSNIINEQTDDKKDEQSIKYTDYGYSFITIIQ
jgi:hypothetical protein